MSTEEPRIERALARLMELLDGEVPKVLIRTSFASLDKDVVRQAEETLDTPNPLALEHHVAEARHRVKEMLHKWLESYNDLLHFRSE